MPWIISNGKSYVEINGMNQMITTRKEMNDEEDRLCLIGRLELLR